MAKGYLMRSEKGAPYPTGFICPWCGSGTHIHKTGALTFYDTPNAHFACHACSNGGDVINFLSKIYGIDNHGKEFFSLIRKAADVFALPYDPTIFERKQPARDSVADVFADNDDLRGKLREWQGVKGAINPDVLPKIKTAAEYVASLTPKNFTADDAVDVTHQYKVALCQFYLPTVGNKFFSVMNDAIKRAKAAVKKFSASSSKKQPSTRALAVAKLTTTETKNAVEKLVTQIQQEHKYFVKAEQQRKEYEQAQAERVAREAEVNELQARLNTLKRQDPSPERDAAIIQLINDSCEWKYDKHANPVAVKDTFANLNMIYRDDPNLDGLFAYDEFQDTNVFLKAPPWNKNKKHGDQWQDADDAQLRWYLRGTYTEFANADLVRDGFTEYARQRSFNVVKDYFANLPAWDGKPRAETFFIDWLRVPDTPYARAVTMNWLTAAVARIFFPGVDYQTVLVLQGAQGVGKDFNLKQLAVNWHAAIVDSLDSGDAIDVLKLAWIGVIEEMNAVSKASINAVKSFLSRNSDERREKYGRHAKRVQRHCVFAITTNDQNFLNDVTGNRRYLILHCGSEQSQPVMQVRGERLTDDNVVKQIWAEVYARYQEQFKDITDIKLVASKLLLPADVVKQAAEIAEQHVNDNGGVEGIIKTFVDTKIPDPAVWSLLSREQRRDFIAKGGVIALYRDDLIAKRNARGGRHVADDVSKIYQLCTSDNQLGDSKLYNFYGTEYRQHICATEIRDECFDKTDKRGKSPLVHETLARLDGWTLGKRIQKDPVYGDQKKCYWRDADNIPTDDETTDNPQPHKKDYFDDLGGEPIAPKDTPF